MLKVKFISFIIQFYCIYINFDNYVEILQLEFQILDVIVNILAHKYHILIDNKFNSERI